MPLTNQWSRKTICAVLVMMAVEVFTLSGPNVCMVQQKYNITKRVKYRAPMSIRTYEWCFSMPPRCSKWSTEMRDLTRLETEERTAEVAVCCPGYKMKDVSCVPICPNGKTGHGCSEDCPPNKWGPNCVNECAECLNGICLPTTGECDCEDGWQGESCQVSMPTTQPPPALMEELLTTTKSSIRTVPSTISTIPAEQTQPFVPFFPSSTRASVIKQETTSTKLTLSTTEKTEIPTVVNTILQKQTTSLPLNKNITLTTLTPVWVDKTTIVAPKFTIANSIYNRTEIPIEGTSVNLSVMHVPSSKMEVSVNKKPLTTTSNTTSAITISTTTTTNISPIKLATTSTLATTTPKTVTNSSKAATLFIANIYGSGTTFSPLITSVSTLNPNPITFSITAPNFTPSSTEITTKISTMSSSSITSHTTPTTTKNATTFTTYSTTTPKVTTVLGKEITDKDTVLNFTSKPEVTTKFHSTTIKFKPKEIWIKPTQKGESTLESKLKNFNDLHTKSKTVTNKNEAITENTTPKTIIVSIIPTSVSHATFKKISLTTASYLYQNSNITLKFHNKTDQAVTKSMTSQASTAIPFTIKILPTLKAKTMGISKTTTQLSQHTIRTATPVSKKASLYTTLPEKQTSKTETKLNTTFSMSRTTNSMSTLYGGTKLNSSTLTIKPSTNKDKLKLYEITTVSTKKQKPVYVKDEATNRTDKISVTRTSLQESTIKIFTEKASSKRNATKIFNKVTTQEPEDETFHILTEPEHITAVMNEKERDHTSMDLISVLSIAGGVMMAVITVAVVIVMIERCRRPRYDNVRKINDIRMQVMIDNNDAPPPYVRSIFHAPLPDPPHSEKCHYQPISTLDRNLKQFMRPVTVQSISPVMLENFRGILECHYDHLPRRNHDFGTMPVRCAMTTRTEERRPLSVADYTIEALRCEAKLDVIDNTTSEPLYAEIPCWRPPSEHAIAVVNLNGEAITEL